MSTAKIIVYGLLAVIMLAGVISTAWTIIPDSSAAVNFMGTRTHCPFVPYSTYGSVAAAIVGAIIFLIARRLWK